MEGTTDTEISLHIHADAGVLETDGTVTLPLRGLPRGVEQEGGHLALQSVIVSTSRDTERLARDTNADRHDFELGRGPVTSGRLDLRPVEDAVAEQRTNTNAPRPLPHGAHKFDDYYYNANTTKLTGNLACGGLVVELLAGDALVLLVQGTPGAVVTVPLTTESTGTLTRAELVQKLQTALRTAYSDISVEVQTATHRLRVTRSATTDAAKFTLHTGAEGRTRAQQRRLASLLGLADHDTRARANDPEANDTIGRHGNGKLHAFSTTLVGYRPIRMDKDKEGAELLRYEYSDTGAGHAFNQRFVYALSLRTALAYREYAGAFVLQRGPGGEAGLGGQRVELKLNYAAGAGGGATPPLPGGLKGASAVLYARCVAMPTDIDGRQGERGVLLFRSYEAAVAPADEGRAVARSPAIVDLGPQPGGGNYLTTGTEAEAHAFTILNRSVLDVPAAFADAVDAAANGGALEYHGTRAPVQARPTGRRRVTDTADGAVAVDSATVAVERVPVTTVYMRRLRSLDDASSSASSSTVRVVLFPTALQASQSYAAHVGFTASASATNEYQRAVAYATAARALPLVRSAVSDTAAGGAPRAEYATDRHYFAVKQPHQGRSSWVDRSTDQLVLTTSTGGTVANMRTGDVVQLCAVPPGAPRPYVYPDPGIPHFFDASPAPGQLPVEESTYYLHLLSPPPSTQPTQQRGYLCLTREAALRASGPSAAERLALGAWWGAQAQQPKAAAGVNQGRVRLVKLRRKLAWNNMYVEFEGFAGSDATGVTSTDEHVAGKLAVTVPRTVVNTNLQYNIGVPTRGNLRHVRMRLAVQDEQGEHREVRFPDDAERVDVILRLTAHQDSPETRAARFRQLLRTFMPTAGEVDFGNGQRTPLMPFLDDERRGRR